MKLSQFLMALAAAHTAIAVPTKSEDASDATSLLSVVAEDNDFPFAELEAYYVAKLSESSETESSIQARQFSGSTFNQLTDGTPCRPVTVIYARGTTQAGNVGDANAVGPVFFNALASRIGAGNMAVQGVDYAANVAGFLVGGDPTGSRRMSELAARAASQCPSTKIVLSGYSQGAQLVHNAAGQISNAVANRVSAVLTFGDPKRDQGFGAIPSSRTRVICRSGDNICDGGIIITPAHSQYQQDAPAAAAWVAGLV